MDWREEQVLAHVRERRPQLPIRNELGTVCEIEAMARLPSEEERTLSHLKFKDNTAGPTKRYQKLGSLIHSLTQKWSQRVRAAESASSTCGNRFSFRSEPLLQLRPRKN